MLSVLTIALCFSNAHGFTYSSSSLLQDLSDRKILKRNEQQIFIPSIEHSQSSVPNVSYKCQSRSCLNAVNVAAATWITTSVLGGLVGVPAVAGATKSWYRRINLPTWTPPDRIFAPVWTTLYAFIGYSFYKIHQIQSKSFAMNLAFLHYALNISWPFIFFGLQRLRAGFAMNLTLVASLLAIIPMFYKIYPLSAWLLVPYLAWLLFATKLNQTICKLNPTKSEKGYNNAMLQADIYKLQLEAGKKAGL